jgi:formylglycine-generating enzyme
MFAVRWSVLVLAIGCQGEPVVEVTNDAAPSDARTDAPGSETIVSVDCGSYSGPKMVRIGSFCIDATEVTRAEMIAMLKVPRGERNAPAFCAWNTTDTMITETGTELDFPAGFSNFCDAATYCAWRGKRLCGKIGGGVLKSADYADAKQSEWFSVCSVNGTQTYPYPGEYDDTKCWTKSGTTEAVASKLACTGADKPFSEVYDLSGNIVEWENACDSWPPAASTECRQRGGEWGAGANTTCAWNKRARADDRSAGSGFRCCKDAP